MRSKAAITALAAAACLALAPTANAAFGDGFGIAPINDDEGQVVPAMPEQHHAFWAGTCVTADAPAPGEQIPGGIGVRPAELLGPGSGIFNPAPTPVPAPITPPHCIDWGDFSRFVGPENDEIWTRAPSWRQAPVTQAGAHPDGNAMFAYARANGDVDGSVDNIRVDLPPGFLANPRAVPQCSQEDFIHHPPRCSPESQVGVMHVFLKASIFGNWNDGNMEVFPIYNLEPRKGRVAEFGTSGFADINATSVRITGVPRTNGDFGVTTFIGQIPAALPLAAQSITLWGVPWDRRNDLWRRQTPVSGPGGLKMPMDGLPPGERATYDPSWGETGEAKPFIINETDCNPSPTTKLLTDSFQHPGPVAESGDPDLSHPRGDNWKVYESAVPAVSGCEKLGFGPDITMNPVERSGDAIRQADSPSGLDVELTIPQNNDLPFDPPDESASQSEIDSYLQEAIDHWRSDAGLATAHLKDTTVTLPEGMTLNPAAAGGMAACSTEQIGLTDTDSSEPPSIRFNDEPVDCPAASKVGTVLVETPLLAEEDWPTGHVYLAMQGDNPFDSDFAIYLVISSPDRGLRIKLAGEVTPDPETGQLETTFVENPELPFDTFRLRFKGGARAPLATPSVCGTHASQSEFASHAQPGNPVTVNDSFGITGSPAAGCADELDERPFSIDLTAGSEKAQAGEHTAFHARFTRGDGNQELDRIELTTPEGFTADISGIPYCSEGQIARAENRTDTGDGQREKSDPSCPEASKIGTTTIGAGAGASPYYVTGNVYLAGPYKAAPLSLAFVVPAVAGPFDLGVQVVRAQLQVHDRTAQITTVSDEIPTILRGVPLRIRDIRVNIDREGFGLNPTNCKAQEVAGTIHGSHGASTRVSNRFGIRGCAALDFKPRFAMRILNRGRRSTIRSFNPRMRFVVAPRPGHANMGPTQITLPSSVILDQSNIRTVCTRPQFAADRCPKRAIYGYAKAWSPLLDEPVQGPVYLGSSDNLLPDLIADLQGQVPVVLQGQIDSARGGRMRNTFRTVPDVPVTRFQLDMFGGANRGVLVNSTDLCRSRERGVALFFGQNGKRSVQRPRIGLRYRGCRKVLRMDARKRQIRRRRAIRRMIRRAESPAQARQVLRAFSRAQARRAARS